MDGKSGVDGIRHAVHLGKEVPSDSRNRSKLGIC
jgi:hypothetical protein